MHVSFQVKLPPTLVEMGLTGNVGSFHILQLARISSLIQVLDVSYNRKVTFLRRFN